MGASSRPLKRARRNRADLPMGRRQGVEPGLRRPAGVRQEARRGVPAAHATRHAKRPALASYGDRNSGADMRLCRPCRFSQGGRPSGGNSNGPTLHRRCCGVKERERASGSGHHRPATTRRQEARSGTLRAGIRVALPAGMTRYLLPETEGEPGDPRERRPLPLTGDPPRPGRPVNITCPECKVFGQVCVGTVVDEFVYLRCAACGGVWSEPRSDGMQRSKGAA